MDEQKDNREKKKREEEEGMVQEYIGTTVVIQSYIKHKLCLISLHCVLPRTITQDSHQHVLCPMAENALGMD